MGRMIVTQPIWGKIIKTRHIVYPVIDIEIQQKLGLTAFTEIVVYENCLTHRNLFAQA